MRRSSQPAHLGVLLRHVRVLGKNLLQIRLLVADISNPSARGGSRSLRGCFGRARSGALRTLRGRRRARVPEVLPVRCRSPQVFLDARLGRATACGRAHPLASKRRLACKVFRRGAGRGGCTRGAPTLPASPHPPAFSLYLPS